MQTEVDSVEQKTQDLCERLRCSPNKALNDMQQHRKATHHHNSESFSPSSYYSQVAVESLAFVGSTDLLFEVPRYYSNKKNYTLESYLTILH
jgi:hypothetical protein